MIFCEEGVMMKSEQISTSLDLDVDTSRFPHENADPLTVKSNK